MLGAPDIDTRSQNSFIKQKHSNKKAQGKANKTGNKENKAEQSKQWETTPTIISFAFVVLFFLLLFHKKQYLMVGHAWLPLPNTILEQDSDTIRVLL